MGNFFHLAMEHHQAGRLDLAEVLYRKILDDDPHDADALNLLGVLAQELGRPEQAIEYIEQAIALNPGSPAYLVNLGEIYRARGNIDRPSGISARPWNWILPAPRP